MWRERVSSLARGRHRNEGCTIKSQMGGGGNGGIV